MRILWIGVAVMIGGCMPVEPVQPAQEQIPTRDDPRFTCSIAKLQPMIGRTGTAEVGAQAMRTAGARALRWIRPDSAYTMDYRTDRLNIHIDRQSRITKVTCG